MDVREFDFDLPPELIAQEPAAERGAARLLHLDRRTGGARPHDRSPISRAFFAKATCSSSTTRASFPRGCSAGACRAAARSSACWSAAWQTTARTSAGAGRQDWEALMHPGRSFARRARRLRRPASRCTARCSSGGSRPPRDSAVDRATARSVDDAVDAIGHVPLPPYIKRDDRREDRDGIRRCSRASAARWPRRPPACTSPARSTPRSPRAASRSSEITLHVGYGTFQPVRVERVEDHRLEPERYEISRDRGAGDQPRARRGPPRRRRRHDDDADARGGGGGARRADRRRARARPTCSSIPGFDFRVVAGTADQLSPAAIVAADAGVGVRRPRAACWRPMRRAIAERYRFYSYGDAMLVT